MPKVLLVIPTYNERENIVRLINEIVTIRKNYHLNLDILVSDSNSPDRTAVLVDQLARNEPGVFSLITAERGIGLGLLNAFDWALTHDYEVIMQIDADFSHNPQDIPRLLDKLNQGYDIVTGSRYVTGGRIEDWSLDRKFLSWSANLTIRLLTGIWEVHEFTTNYRAFRSSVYQALKNAGLNQLKDNTFLIAFLYQAHCLGCKIGEVPITYTERTAGVSKIKIADYIPNLLKYLIKMRFQNLTSFLNRVSQ